MLDLEKIVKEGAKFKDGKIYDRFGCSVLEYDARVFEFGWGIPRTCYKFSNYSLSDYSIEKATQYEEWYLKKGSCTICTLKRLGGENWETL